MTGTLENTATGEVHELVETSIIGRHPGGLVVIADPRVSRRHAQIRWQEDGFWFIDLGSSNGSHLNGKRVTTLQLLKDGDVLTIGRHVFRFRARGVPLAQPDAFDPELTLPDVGSRELIMLVSDIQGFSSLAEKLDPDSLAPIIGSWYSQTASILEEHGATIDKFIGDSVFAYWLDTSTAARVAAVEAARALLLSCDRVQQLHESALAAAGARFSAGFALHFGPAAYGGFGAGEFTLIGDAVNLVFRLETLTRKLGRRALVSGEFLGNWHEGKAMCESLGAHQVKGREQPIEVFALPG